MSASSQNGGGKVEEVQVTSSGDTSNDGDASSSTKLPTFYISHGGGPCFFMKPEDLGGMADMGPQSKMANVLRHLGDGLKPKALLVISAHWETRGAVTIASGEKPAMYYDYGGFPDYTYKLQWPAPGNPALSQRLQKLLAGAGIDAKLDSKRGYDHGVFVPMLLAYPDAHIPTVCVSLRSDLDPAFHIDLGKALAPLRSEGVLIIGSGFSFHGFGARARRDVKLAGANAFDEFLNKSVTGDVTPKQRADALVAWAKAPGARLSHPREEHLLPLHVAVGAAGGDAGKRFYNEPHSGGFLTSMFRFG